MISPFFISSISVSAADEVSYVAGEVVAAVSSMEEALEVADYYGITLKSYAYGMAVYTEPTAETCIISAQSYSDMPTLYQNRIYTIFEEDETDETLETTLTYDAKQYYHDDIHTSEAWEYGTGEGVLVAVIDTGIDIDHEALTHAISEDMAYNSYTDKYGLDAVDDDYGHGTKVAGIIAAEATETSDVTGIAPDVDLLVIKANIEKTQDFTLVSLVRGINYAVEQGADIINLSLGSSYDAGDFDDEREAIEAAVSAGVTIVCAAGNFKEDHAAYPAAYDSTIAVSAVGNGFSFASTYSSYGEEIDIAAAGTSVYTTAYNGGYTYDSGTSMASPVVAGVAALIMSANSETDYTPEEIKSILCDTAMEAGDLGYDEYYGYGIVNAYSAVLGVDELFEVTYYNGDTVIATTYVAPGDSLITPNNLSGAGIFSGWTSSLYGLDTWNFETAVTEDMKIYADWELYIEENGTESTVSITVDLGSLVSEVDSYSGVSLFMTVYENGKMRAISLEGYDNESSGVINISATYEGSANEAKIFVLNSSSSPLCGALEYSLDIYS